MRTLKNGIFSVLGIIFFLCLFYACARIGTPQGGAYDLKPPRYLASTPQPNATEYNGKKIEIIFDELVNIDKPTEKVIITPPQKKSPEIKSQGKKITIELKDSLLPNTTYTFDFTDGIVDNNEKNALENFSFAFSTGAVVDSLVIGGILLNAENLEPMPNIMVGLHTNFDDTAFTHIPFVRTTKTNDRGRFWVRNVASGSYHIFALNDMNRDYRFDQPGEDIAFFDSIFVPTSEPAFRTDTIWKDSLTIDTLKEVAYTRFLPNDVKLFLFKEKFAKQFLSKTERTEHALSLHFNSVEASDPVITLFGVKTTDDWAIPEYSEDGKSVQFWIKDSLIYQMDTLRFEVDYLKSDSLNKLVQVKDTFGLALRKRPTPKKSKSDSKKIEFLQVNFSSQSVADVFDTIKITFDEPLLAPDLSKIRMEQKVDTLWKPVEFSFVADSLNPRMYYLKQKWPYEEEYRISIDSASFYSFYGKWNNKAETEFKFRKESDYGNLYVTVTGASNNGFGELLDGSDKVVRKSNLIDGELIFQNVKPGKYYLRYIDDSNGNGKWDTGNYAEKRPPETVYYYSTFFDVRQNFEIEQSWDVKDVSVEKQKPLEITKNKPVEKKPKRDPNVKSTNSNSSTNSSSSGSNRQNTDGTGNPNIPMQQNGPR